MGPARAYPPAIGPGNYQHTTMTSFSISPRSVLRVAPFVARNDIRFYLNGFLVEKAPHGGVYVVGTDGTTMAIDYDAGGRIDGAERVIARFDRSLSVACRAALRSLLKDKMRVRLDDNRLTINIDEEPTRKTEAYVKAGEAVIDGNYPKWREVLPKFDALKPGMNCKVNSTMLARFAEVAADKGANELSYYQWSAGIKLWQAEPEEVVAIQIPTIQTMIGLLMPMRDLRDDTEKALLARMAALVPQVKEGGQ